MALRGGGRAACAPPPPPARSRRASAGAGILGRVTCPPRQLLRRGRGPLRERSTDFTVGLEEEFQILDPDTLALADGFEELRDAAPPRARRIARRADHLARSRSPPRSARRSPRRPARLVARRAGLFALARDHGYLLGATGTHPFSRWQDQRIIDTPHYRARRRRAQVRRLAQQHVERPRARRRARHRPRHRHLRRPARLPAAPARAVGQLAVHRSGLDAAALGAHPDLRPDVPALRHPRHLRLAGPSTGASSRSSSTRTASRSSRRSGGACGRTTSTARSRCASATCRPSRGRRMAIAALGYGLVAALAADVRRGSRRCRCSPTRYIEENLWRAIRYGLDGKLVDWLRRRRRAARGAGGRRRARAGRAGGAGRRAARLRRPSGRRRAPAGRGQRRPAPGARPCRRASPSTRSTPRRWRGPTRSPATAGEVSPHHERRRASRRGKRRTARRRGRRCRRRR